MPLNLPAPKTAKTCSNEEGVIISAEESADEDDFEQKKLKVALTTQIFKEDVRIIL
jgi:hypothetical protein